jgi:type VI secretion system protein ImpK
MSPTASSQTVAARRRENLALAFQEALTVSSRLRSGRQGVTDAASFRHHVLETLKAADQYARARGYTAEDIKLAVFAVVAFVDESVLNLRSPIFADWPRRPLQEELFGHHIAGEVFFRNLQELLGRNDSQGLADLIEVYHLCLLLGFAGRYSLGGRGELRSFIDSCADKIRRIRGAVGVLSPGGALPQEAPRQAEADPWVRKLLYAAAGCFVLSLILFLSYKWILSSGAATLSGLGGFARL